MPDYLLVHPRPSFEEILRPALSEAWRLRSFRGCALRLPSWQAAAREYARQSHIPPEEIFLLGFSPEIPFERYLWRTLVGELLVVLAVEMPELPSNLASLARLLVPSWRPPATIEPPNLPPLLQALHGSRELTFGLATYRPGFAAWNSGHDNRQVRDLLCSIDPNTWSVETIQNDPPLAEAEDLLEELAFAKQWFAILVDLYERLVREDRIAVFETVHG